MCVVLYVMVSRQEKYATYCALLLKEQTPEF